MNYKVDVPVHHSSAPHSTSAELAVEYWSLLQEFAHVQNSGTKMLFEKIQPSLQTIQTQSDGLSCTTTMEIGVRLPVGFSLARLPYPEQSEEVRPVVVKRGYEPAYAVGKHTSLVRSFSAAIRSHNQRPKFKYKTGTSDMNVVGPVWNCEMLAYGPGDSKLDHTPFEHLSLPEYLTSIEVLKTAIMNWCQASIAEDTGFSKNQRSEAICDSQ